MPIPVAIGIGFIQQLFKIEMPKAMLIPKATGIGQANDVF